MIKRPKSPVHLDESTLDWALLHLRRSGDTIFVPRAFEYDAIQHDWVRIRAWLSARDMRSWTPRPWRRFLATKTAGSFRYITQLDPLEHLAFAALMRSVGAELEEGRVARTLQTVFSWRFVPQPDGTLYDPTVGWVEFNDRCSELAAGPSIQRIVVADIADFFPHVGLQAVERTLAQCASTQNYAYCVFRLLMKWTARAPYGIPVGPPSCRVLADATLAQLDNALSQDGAIYCRYSDDCRIFCNDESDARRRLEFLATHLFDMYGLTLQSSKTAIYAVDEFLAHFAMSPERLEAEGLESKLDDLLDAAGVDRDYGASIEYADLPTHVQEEIDRLNISEIVREQIARPKYDAVLLSLLLQRLAQLDQDEVVDDLLNNLQHLEPIINSTVRYLSELRITSLERCAAIGKQIINTLQRNGTSAYQAMCLLSIFAESASFDNSDELESLFADASEAGRRELVLAFRQVRNERWFVAARDSKAFGPWLRRAFLAGTSCLSAAQRAEFLHTYLVREDVLEQAIVNWATA